MLGCVPSSMSNLPPQLSSGLDKILRILTWVQAIYGCMLTLVNLMGGLVMLMTCMILYSIRFYGNTCSCICYMIIAGLEAITSATLIGAVISSSAEAADLGVFMLMMNMCKLPFYLVSGYYVYLAYKELRQANASYQDSSSYRSMDQPSNFSSYRSENQSQFRAFSGEGYRIG